MFIFWFQQAFSPLDCNLEEVFVVYSEKLAVEKEMEADKEIPHPYIPRDLNLPGYVPLVLSMQTILGVYGIASVLVLTFIWIISGTKKDSFSFLGCCDNPIMVEISFLLQLLMIYSVRNTMSILGLKGLLITQILLDWLIILTMKMSIFASFRSSFTAYSHKLVWIELFQPDKPSIKHILQFLIGSFSYNRKIDQEVHARQIPNVLVGIHRPHSHDSRRLLCLLPWILQEPIRFLPRRSL